MIDAVSARFRDDLFVVAGGVGRSADRQVVPLAIDVVGHELRRLAEPSPVLARVMARFRMEVAREEHQFGAHALDALVRIVGSRQQGLGAVDMPRPHHVPDPRDQILVSSAEGREPRRVIQSSALERDLVVRDAELVRELLGRALHAVAESDDLHAGQLRRPAVHRHRVRVVEEPCVRADQQHRLGHLTQGLDGAKPSEHAAWSQGVAHGLIDAVLPGDLDVGGVGVEPADLEHRDHDVGPAEGGSQIARHLDARGRAGDVDQGARRFGSALGSPEVDVVEDERRPAEGWERQDVAGELEREDPPARADDHDPGSVGHVDPPRSGPRLKARAPPSCRRRHLRGLRMPPAPRSAASA